jgi:hypothetical protein
MAEQMRSSPPSVPERIPRYVSKLNAMAVEAGLAVEMAVEPYSDDPELRLFSKWRGPRAAFLALVNPVASYRLPLCRGTLNIPGGSGYYSRNALISGVVVVSGDEVVFEIDFGPLTFAIMETAGVQIVTYEDEIVYHADPETLLAFGIKRSRLPLKKRTASQGRDYKGEEEWRSRRQPDGTIVHWVESPAAFRRRRKSYEDSRPKRERILGIESEQPTPAPRHLRLVVDNTREGPQ